MESDGTIGKESSRSSFNDNSSGFAGFEHTLASAVSLLLCFLYMLSWVDVFEKNNTQNIQTDYKSNKMSLQLIYLPYIKGTNQQRTQ